MYKINYFNILNSDIPMIKKALSYYRARLYRLRQKKLDEMHNHLQEIEKLQSLVKLLNGLVHEEY